MAQHTIQFPETIEPPFAKNAQTGNSEWCTLVGDGLVHEYKCQLWRLPDADKNDDAALVSYMLDPNGSLFIYAAKPEQIGLTDTTKSALQGRNITVKQPHEMHKMMHTLDISHQCGSTGRPSR